MIQLRNITFPCFEENIVQHGRRIDRGQLLNAQHIRFHGHCPFWGIEEFVGDQVAVKQVGGKRLENG